MISTGTNSMLKSVTENGGNGVNSYFRNSSLQREASVITKAVIDEAISQKLDIKKFTISTTFCIADLRCAGGPNHTTNDFNAIFASLPHENHYFAAGVPGSFYGRLFPEFSLHIVHASYALHWLSRVPEDVLDRDSPAWNKGKIYYASASVEVANPYAAQFAKGMDNFLNLKAKEIAKGGMMQLVMTANEDEYHRSQMASGLIFDVLGSCLYGCGSCNE